MHDFLLAKEIIEELKKIAQEKKIIQIKKVTVEIGSIALSHDGLPEHAEDISLENLTFGLKNLAKGKLLEKTQFSLRKTVGENWKITDIEV